MLAGVFMEVLGLEEVSIDESFFALGGHSLKATRVVNLIESLTGIRLPLRTLFERSTVAAIGELLSELGPRSFEPIPPAALQRDYPMSSAQKRLYVIHQMDDLGTVYNMPGVMKLEGTLDPARIQATFQALIRRHEGLRTSFHIIEGELLQRIEEDAVMEFTCEELDYGVAADAAGLLDAFTTPFDLAQAPLLRAKAVKTGADQSLLLFDMHHIISDAATIQLIMKEFTQLYNGEILPPLTVQYKDYSEWLRRRDLHGQEKYWLEQFDGEIPVLDLPLDYPRPQTRQFSGGSFTLNLKPAVRAQVQRLSRETGTTEYMVLLASFMVLLHKYTRQEDVIVGTPISGRTHPDTEAMVGMFVNTLALRGRPAGEKTYAGFLSEVREVCLQAYSHQEYPLEDLVERVQVQRDMSRNPLFDVVFVLQNDEEVGASAEGMTIQEEEMLPAAAKFDLTVTVEPGSAGYAVNWAYCDVLFKEESIRRMAVHFEQILEEALGAPRQKIREMEVVTEQEKGQILQVFNEDKAEYDTGITVADMFAEQVRRVPGRIAAVCDGDALTYAELDRRAGRIAAQLRQRIATEAMVGIRLERELNLVVAILGVVQAGGVYLPIDPDAPAERTGYILADSGVQVLLTSRALYLNALFSGEVLYVEDLLAEEGVPEEQQELKLRPEQGLYVIYTSGTTGHPKGTVIEHRNVVRLLKNSAFPFEFTEEDVWSLFHGTHFDFSVWEMYGALLYGGKLVIVPKGTAQDSYALRELLLREQVTVLNQVPSSFYELMQAEASEATGKLALRYLIFGGEALNPRKLKAWWERYPEVEIVNMYGITETTVHVTYKTVTGQDIEVGISNIGRAIPTTSVYILNGTRLCGIGMPGELCVGGAGVARGYYNRPELTAAKFVENPYVPGERMYRSGDLARWLPDGSMEYLGRMDEQVKIRGYRIELGEIEQVLIQQAGIRDAAVIIREDAAAEKYICAYVVKTAAEGLEPTELKKALQRQLPEYMIPGHIVALEKLPVTVNGKLDQKRLPEPVLSTGSEYTAPRNGEEAMLAEIFEQVLGVERIGIDDSFFELGG
ncbi:MAG: amino acid adenylation domain-containing protein, partial [Gorillibacterium sp.]|nr:amino acid adenylation domain-containing protein [Gorillibacterium sp.]